MKKYCLSLLFSVSVLSGLLISIPGSASAADPPAKSECPKCQTEAEQEKVLSKLLATAVTVKGPGGTGSGTIILRGEVAFVLTAGHVVAECRQEEDAGEGKKVVTFADAKIYQIEKDEETGRRVGEVTRDCEVIRYSSAEHGQDLAVLRVRKKGVFKVGGVFYTDKKLPVLGSKLWHVGSPFGDFGASSVIPGSYSQHGRVLFDTMYDQISCNAFPGSSGGMITTEDGRYLGMVLRGAPGGFILIRPVREIERWARKTGMEFLLDPKLEVPSDDELKKKPIEDKVR